MEPQQEHLTDDELLHRYTARKTATTRSPSLFDATSISSTPAASRQVGDAALAEDVTQAVFVILARKHAGVRKGKLAGWLFNTARLVARNAIKMQIRRRKYEQRAAAERSEITIPEPGEWEQISPQLDAAVARLGQGERDVVLMHFFQQIPLDEVGKLLGISEAAARKRSSRAIEKLREILGRRGVETTAASLTAGLATHAMIAAPAHLTAPPTFTAGSAAVHLASAVSRASVLLPIKIAAAITTAIAITGTSAVVVHRQYAAAPIVIPIANPAPARLSRSAR